ncbi:MAG TPA: hypothetical protein VK714_02670 [Myxococcota bacterium]|nr:hypothetical protein [Myxococcota bacterium]
MRLRLIPPPAKELGPSEALEWLREWRSSYAQTVGAGFPQDDGYARAAFDILAQDLDCLVGACIDAIAEQKSFRVTRDLGGPYNLELFETVRELTQITTLAPMEGRSPADESALKQLGAELMRRLKELENHGYKPAEVA